MHVVRCVIALAFAVALCSAAVEKIGYWGCNAGGHASTLPQLQSAINRGYNVIVFAFYLVDANGGIIEDPGSVPTPTKNSVSSTNFKYLVSLFGGQNGAAPTLTINYDVWAQNMFNNFVNLNHMYGFDGIDIDLENAWGGTGDQIICGLRTFFKLLHNAGYIVSMAPQTTALTPEVPSYATGSWNSYAPLADTGIIDYVDIVAVQLYNNAVPYNSPAQYAQALINGFQVTGCPTCPGVTGFVKVPACKIAMGYPATVGAAPSGCPGLSGGCPYGSALTSLYNGNSVLKSTNGVMTWSVEWDEVGGWAFINAANNIAFTSSCSSSSTTSRPTTSSSSSSSSTTVRPTTSTTASSSTTVKPTTSSSSSSTIASSSTTVKPTTSSSSTTSSTTGGSFTCAGKADGMYCSGRTTFRWCPQNIEQSCGAGTVCQQNGNTIVCGFA